MRHHPTDGFVVDAKRMAELRATLDDAYGALWEAYAAGFMESDEKINGRSAEDERWLEAKFDEWLKRYV